MLKDKQPEESDGKRIVFHRNSKHPEYESKDCPECLRCLEEFKQSEADGTLAKELPSVEESNWKKRFEKEFIRDDSLMDKYVYVDNPESEIGNDVLTTGEAIVKFIETELTKAHNQAIDRAVGVVELNY